MKLSVLVMLSDDLAVELAQLESSIHALARLSPPKPPG